MLLNNTLAAEARYYQALQTGQIDTAIRIARLAAASDEKRGDCESAGVWLRHLSFALFHQGRYENGAKAAWRALSTFSCCFSHVLVTWRDAFRSEPIRKSD